MLRRLFIPLVLLLCCAGCSTGIARRIPKDTLAAIYADMYISDQWLLRHQTERKKTDTLAIYEPIMKRYGYCFQDYDKTVLWYVEHPDRFQKVVTLTREILKKKHLELEGMLEIQEANRKLEEYLRGVYIPETFWPALLDSSDFSIKVQIRDSVGYAQGRDSIRTDPEPQAGEVVRDKFIAVEREDMQF